MKKIENWNDYLSVVEENALSTHIFRGESNSDYKLKPGAGRDRKGQKKYNLSMEQQLLENFKQRIALLVQVSQLDDWDILAYAQHVGVPTRLLDWSLSPLVALFFALEGEQDSDRVVYVYKCKQFVGENARKSGPLNSSSSKSPVVETFIPKQFHPRIKAQRGVFTIHSNPTDEFKPESLKRIVIAKNSVMKLKKNLFKMGFDYWHIYPDSEGLGKQLKWQFDHGVPITG